MDGQAEHIQQILEQDKSMPIAIVGISCRMPGDATDPDKLWKLVAEKRSPWTKVPKDRMNIDSFYHPDGERSGNLNATGGHFLTQDVGAFDTSFFSISPSEAKSMDPQQRLLMECVYESMESAGIPMDDFSGTQTSCYVGCFGHDYYEIMNQDMEVAPLYASTGNGLAILSNRISYFYDLKGPSLTLDTACSSSLVALHLGCQSLRTGESKCSIVGATNLIFNPDLAIAMSSLHFLSPDSRCYTYDSRANGYARGEGIAALILKPLAHAIKDNDTIRAVIRGTACNQDGKTSGIMLPSRTAQESLIRTAYETSGCDPSQTAYFEAHGTGTPAGDPLESGAIGSTLGQCRPVNSEGQRVPLYVGSIKTNIGHTEGTSGLAGLIKAVMSLENGAIAPNMNYENPNPNIDFEGWNIKVPTELIPWPTPGLRRISVNSFGFGGTNGHVILDDAYHYLETRGIKAKHRTSAKPLSATLTETPSNGVKEGIAANLNSNTNGYSNGNTNGHSNGHTNGHSNGHVNGHSNGYTNGHASENSNGHTNGSSNKHTNGDANGHTNGHANGNGTKKHSLNQAIQRYRIFLTSASEESSSDNNMASLASHIADRKENDENNFLDNLAYTLNSRRSMLPFKSFVVANSKEDLTQKLSNIHQTPLREHPEAPRLAFVFTGQGAQWNAMGRELASVYSVYRRRLEDAEEELFKCGATWSLLEELSKPESETRVNEPIISQPATTALQIALVDLFASWGVTPYKVIGHSSGEIAAAYTAGALPFESAIQVAYYRGVHSSQVKSKLPTSDGAMMAAGVSGEDAQKLIDSLDPQAGKAYVACINSPTNVTLSGDRVALQSLEKSLKKDQVFTRFLKVQTAYHSHHMEAVSSDYYESIANISVSKIKPSVEMVSTVTGCLVDSETILGPQYWVDNMKSQVRFSQGLQKLCLPKAGGNKTTLGIGSQVSVDNLVEIGPHAALAGPIKQILGTPGLQKGGITYTSILSRGTDACKSSLEAAAYLFAKGYNLDLHKINFPSHPETKPTALVDLPPYSWNHTKRHWIESRLSMEHRFRRHPRSDLLGYPINDWNPMEPHWRNMIKLREQPWVKGHQIQGSIIYPAAGYVCMAIEALRELHKMPDFVQSNKEVKEFHVKDLKIIRALMIPSTEDGVETVFSLRPHKESSVSFSNSWYDFRLYSYTHAEGWAEHAHGMISTLYKGSSQLRTKTLDTEVELSEPRNSDILYKDLAKAGLVYEAPFNNIQKVSSGQGVALGTVRIPDTKSLMPAQYECPHLIHPATLDNFLQVLFPALVPENEGKSMTPYVPASIKDLYIDSSLNNAAGHEFQCLSKATMTGYREITAEIAVTNTSESIPVVRLSGVRCTALASISTDSELDSSNIKKLCFREVWEPDVDLLPKHLANDIVSKYVPKKDSQRITDLETICYYFYLKVLESITKDQLESMAPHYRKFLQYLQHQQHLVSNNQMPHQKDEWKHLTSSEGARMVENLILKWENSNYDIDLILRVGRKLTPILLGEIDPIELMMEGGLLYRYYESMLGFDPCYRFMTLISHKNPDLDILEIGGGTGGATLPILQALGGHSGLYPKFKSYTFTDISSGFFEEAAVKFKDWEGLIDYQRLNIELDPTRQGFEEHKYDLVIAASVLHATSNIDRTLANTRKLLKPGGRLLLLEVTAVLYQSFLVFGCFPGWWMSEEKYREWGPIINEQQWQDALHRNGFGDFTLSVADDPDSKNELGRILSCYAVDPEPTEDAATHSSVYGSIVIITNEDDKLAPNGLVKALEHELRPLQSTNIYTATLSQINETSLENTFCICLAELEESVLRDVQSSHFEALKKIVTQSRGLLWATQGGSYTSSRPESAIMHGLARALRCENETFPLMTADLNSMHDHSDSETAQQLVELLTRDATMEMGVRQWEFWRNEGSWWIKRCVDTDDLNEKVFSITNKGNANNTNPEPVLFDQGDRQLKLKIGTPGLLDTLMFEDDVLPPLQPGEVEIDVKACGVNFRDIMVSTGQLSDKSLGLECSGIITKVGDGVSRLRVGQRVTAWTYGSYSHYVHVPAEPVQPIPDEMDFATAASIPVIYCTALYGLVDIAHIKEGDSVLIHAAAGGVGQAAILLAQLYKAEIFVTVGSQEKRELMLNHFQIPEDHIFSSRDLEFSNQIMEITKGRGIDIILNSLAGDALSATWDCIARFGRFIEIGKKDIADNRRLEMNPFVRNVTFAAIDLLTVFQYDLPLAGKLMETSMSLIRSRKLDTIPNIKSFTYSQFQEAFRYMQGGKHIGKIIMTPVPGDVVEALPRPATGIQFPEDATYLLSGGFGGLGRSISRWMVKQGAKNLIIASRSGTSKPEAQDLVNELRASGATIEALKVDITDKEALETVLDSVLAHMPPLRGVVQSAMVLDDHTLETMSLDMYHRSVQPKVHGTWNLHEATSGLELDFFVILASAVGVLGNSGQGNYGAGNAYEDALTHYRVSQGLPSTVVDLGMMLNIGTVAEDESGLRQWNLERKGFIGMTESELLAVLEVSMSPDLSTQERCQLISGIKTRDSGEDGVEVDEPFWKNCDPTFSHLKKIGRKRSNQASNTGSQSVAALIRAATSPNAAVDIILDAILTKISRSLLIDKTELDPTRPTSAYGVDSLIAVEIRNWFLKEMQSDIPVFEILQSNSLQTLAYRVTEKSALVDGGEK